METDAPRLRLPEIAELLRESPSPWGEAVAIEVQDVESARGADRVLDLLVRVTWNGLSRTFAAEAKGRSSPSTVRAAAQQAEEYASSSNSLPMVVVPYLGDRQVRMLIERGVSGLDLSGNGVIVVPGVMLLCRTGRPNQYPESQPARFAYRGSTSIVPRVFLSRPEYDSVKQIREEIKTRGAVVAPSTVSKALARMEEDVLVQRSGDRIVLVQPEELLDRLASSYRPPRSSRDISLRTSLPLPELFARRPSSVRLTLTGTASMPEYAVGARGDVTAVYCDSVRKLKDALGIAWEETDRFADLRVIETRNKEVYFDARERSDGVVCASPVQAYIELNAGDKRDKQMAMQVRDRVMAGLDR